MLYRFSWRVWLPYSSSYYYDGLQLYFKLDGTAYNVTVKGYNNTEKGWDYSGTTEWYTVSGKRTGNTTLEVGLRDTNTNTVIADSVKSTNLTVIAVAAVMSVGDFDIDSPDFFITVTENINATITRVDELAISCLGTHIKTITGITTTTIYPRFTDAEKATIYSLMSSVTSADFTFVLTRRLNNSLWGIDTKTVKGSITNALPTFDGTKVAYYDTDNATLAVTDNNQCIVQGKSNLYVTIPTATGNKGATISKYTIKIGEVSMTSNASGDVHFGAVAISGDLKLNVTVTDSRGNTVTVQKSMPVLAYAPPIVTAKLTRKNNYEDETHFEVNAVFSQIDGKNSVVVAYQHAKVGEAYPSAEEISNNTEYVLSCNNTDAYNFRITVTDAFGTTVTKEYVLSKGEFPLFIDIEKNAVGINAFPRSSDEALRVGNGVSVLEDGIVIRSSTEESTKMFKICVDDDGHITAIEY